MDQIPKTVWGLTTDQWTAASAIGTILGAGFTFWAVWITLAELRYAQNPKVRIHHSLMTMVNTTGLGEEYFFLKVINTGAIPFVIHCIYWTMGYGLFEKIRGFVMPELNEFTKSLPVTLNPSEEYVAVFKKETFLQWIESFGNDISTKDFPHEYAYSLKMGVSLTHGTEHLKKVDKKMSALVLAAAARIRASKSKVLTKKLDS